ncbi:TPA: peptide chain release factor 1 [bacterium]|nr:peptide chain release factor 1 [bacterium]
MDLERLKEIEERFNELTRLLSQPQEEASSYKKYAQERAALSPIVDIFNEYKKITVEIEETKELAANKEDQELNLLALEELERLELRKNETEERLNSLLLPQEPNDERSAIMEIRAGTGGDESTLFVADLFRMYSRYIQSKGWKIELMSTHSTGIGGFKEIIFGVSGRGVYGQLKYEAGGHRVQRVPATEASGRIHTSAATVAVLPEAEEIEVEIRPEDIRIDVFRSSGPGGQSVNTTDSAVRITHLPTGMVVTCQDEKSQHKNRAKAIRVLRARLLDKAQWEGKARESQERKRQIGSGDRSEKIRTYNFPQNRVTDHRINLTLHKLDRILEGELDELLSALIKSDKRDQLKKVS